VSRLPKITTPLEVISYSRISFRERGDTETATFIEEYADYLEAHIEEWTVARTGTLVEGTSTYFIRILPEKIGDEHPAEDCMVGSSVFFRRQAHVCCSTGNFRIDTSA